MTDFIEGQECKLYYSDTELNGDTDTPDQLSWNEIDTVTDDVNDGSEKEQEIDTTTRGDGEFNTKAHRGITVGPEFTVQKVPENDEELSDLLEAYRNNDPVALAVMDGDIEDSGSEGWIGNFEIASATRQEPQRGKVTYEFSASLASHGEWYEVS